MATILTTADRHEVVYLTMKEKGELAKKGMNVPVCFSGSSKKDSFIAKTRSIFDGFLKGKHFKL